MAVGENSLKNLLLLQELDLAIEECRTREAEIPKRKKKFEIQRERLKAELAEREQARQKLIVEQRDCEREIEAKQEQIKKYQAQLNLVKKNDEYQALLHEIDLAKKQITLREERILGIMVEQDDVGNRLLEDRKRIDAELREIEKQSAEVDKVLDDAVGQRRELEEKGVPLKATVEAQLLRQYTRIRISKGAGAALVPMRNEACGGCHMHILPQIVNEILAGHKVRTCQHCGRLLYHPDNFHDEPVEANS